MLLLSIVWLVFGSLCADGARLSSSEPLEKRSPHQPHPKQGKIMYFGTAPATFSVDWDSVDCDGHYQHPQATRASVIRAAEVQFRGEWMYVSSYKATGFDLKPIGDVEVYFTVRGGLKHLKYIYLLPPGASDPNECIFVNRFADPPPPMPKQDKNRGASRPGRPIGAK